MTRLKSDNKTTDNQAWLFLCRYFDHQLTRLNELGVNASLADKEQLDRLILTSDSVLKNDRTTSVVKIGKSIIKRYNARSRYHFFSRAVRRSRAQRCWAMSNEFSAAGLNIAAPTFMYEQRFGPFRFNAYFISDALQGQELLAALPQMTGQQKQNVVAQVTQAFERMRIAKITHGDMKATNLMWVDERLFFIDLDGAKKHSSESSWQRAHQKDVKRFLKNWQDQPQLLSLFDALV